MIDKEFQYRKYEIVFNALQVGLRIKYKLGWELFLRDNEIYQIFVNPKNGDEKIHRSAVTLSDFTKFLNTLTLEDLKRLFGDTRLIQLQNKLIKRQ